MFASRDMSIREPQRVHCLTTGCFFFIQAVQSVDVISPSHEASIRTKHQHVHDALLFHSKIHPKNHSTQSPCARGIPMGKPSHIRYNYYTITGVVLFSRLKQRGQYGCPFPSDRHVSRDLVAWPSMAEGLTRVHTMPYPECCVRHTRARRGPYEE